MSNLLQKAVIDAANEVAQWKLRAYLAEGRVSELEQKLEDLETKREEPSDV